MREQYSDKVSNNLAGVLIPDGVFTATQVTAIQDNAQGKCLVLSLNVKSAPANTETLSIWFQLVDPVTNSGNNGTLVKFTTPAGSSITANTIYRLVIFPGAGNAPSGMDAQVTLVNAMVPKKWLASIVPSGASNWEYSLGYMIN